MNLGERIRSSRVEHGLTQKQLGERCGMADSAIRRYESGRGNPTYKTVVRIANALGISWLDLVGEEKALELTAGENAAKKILDGSRQIDAILNFLNDLYGSIEEKSALGLYGECIYYLVGTGENKFILHERDIQTLKDIVCNVIQLMIDRLKDTRPECEIIEEYIKQLNSNDTRKAMNEALDRHLKRFSFISASDFNLSPPTDAPEEPPEGE